MVETTLGKIEGADMGSYVEYRSVPYAKPPVGELRWKAPQKLEPWDGVYEAKEFGCRCMQVDHDSSLYTKEFYSQEAFLRESSEDCLYLQIWAPKENKGQKLPVAFWIHGGAFLGGYRNEQEFDGKAYCDRGVILVSVEYRCNIFGFLAHPWLTAESESHCSGNYGILDQIAALGWVYENIGAFGGDKDNITVFGQSAGAMSVQTLVSTKLTGNMIAKAILQSGGSYGRGLHRDITLSEQEKAGEVFSEILGAGSLEEMRAKPAEEIMAAMNPFMEKMMPVMKDIFLTPTIDGKVLEGTYYGLMDAGKIKDIPYMVGSTKDDILSEPGMAERGEMPPLYHGSIAFSHKLEELGRNPAYVYYFTRDLPGSNDGAFHSSELWYMFGTLGRCWRPMEKQDYALSERMLGYWVNFMKTGNPNGDGLEEWKPCTKADPAIMEFDCDR